MKIAIIGGGAAGLALACMLAAEGICPTVYEKQPRVGRKLLSTGNGRCNLTNLNAAVEYYHGDKQTIKNVLDAFSPWDVMDFFGSIGLESGADEEGRVYPLSNQAAGVLDALRLYAQEKNCEFRTESGVTAIAKKGKRFTVQTKDDSQSFDTVVIACGGIAAPKLGACADGYRFLEHFGHTITPRFPAITALKTDPQSVRGLKGIRMHGQLELIVDGKKQRSETGEILFSENGVSGIAAMQLARDVNLAMAKKKQCRLRMNFMPGAEHGAMRTRAGKLPERGMEDFLSGIVPKRLGQTLVSAAGIRPMTLKASELSGDRIDALEEKLTRWELPITGTQSFENAQVTCGGARTAEFDSNTLESKKAENLYAIGEVLDVDGDCGGFNLHWAWASAHAVCVDLIQK